MEHVVGGAERSFARPSGSYPPSTGCARRTFSPVNRAHARWRRRITSAASCLARLPAARP